MRFPLLRSVVLEFHVSRKPPADGAAESRQPSPEPVSKSQRKREAHEVRDLASELIAMGDAHLRRIPLDEDVRRAVHDARRIRSHAARKRQLQYLAKLLRREDVEPIADAIEGFHAEARQLTARHHRAEAWRDHLLAHGDEALSELMEARADLDPQPIRQHVRKARRESESDQPPAAARALFRVLRDLDQAAPLPTLPEVP